MSNRGDADGCFLATLIIIGAIFYGFSSLLNDIGKRIKEDCVCKEVITKEEEDE